MSKSIVQTEKECWMCRHLIGPSVELTDTCLEEHHCIPGIANRRKSEHWGLKVWLCSSHHRNGPLAVHRNKSSMDLLKAKAQRAFVDRYGFEAWMHEFGKNFAD